MARRKKRKVKSNTIDHQATRTSRYRNWKVIAIALYITFLLLSTIPFAADRTVDTDMKESYTYNLRYPRDGRQTHYYVERMNTSRPGKIDLTYTTSSNHLVVDAENIKVLHIYCRSMYEDECKKVFGFDPKDNSNYYKWYFIEKNHLTVRVNADQEIKELSFIDTPIPYKIIVNGEKWEEASEYSYTDNFGTALSNVPGEHTIVDIYFKPMIGTPPTAVLNASRTLVTVNQEIEFDASKSFDSDGTITTHIFDLGDGTFRSGSKQTYQYSKLGTYGVILMVRDNDDLVAHAYVNITVVESSDIPEIQGRVPDQVKPEDSPPWILELSSHEPLASSGDVEFYWYLTGENKSLYTVTGENSSEARLIFNPVPDAFGSSLVTLWLRNTENITVSQPLWINLTPVNDPPTIYGLPDLIIHYDDPYTFNLGPYVNDKETPKDELVLEIFDGYREDYITINGLNATFNYPKKLLGENLYATVMVSDGEAKGTNVFAIQVTSDYVPKLIKPLPDVQIYEGTTKYNIFDLDDYFMDQDNDAIFYSFGQTHLKININQNHTVDMTAASEWTGVEILTFRARDPMGALAEDSVVVTVLPVNDPPRIAGVPDLYVRYGQDYRFELTPYVEDNDNTNAELIIIPSDPDHIRIDNFNNLVIILNYPERYLDLIMPIRLTVSDGLDNDYLDIIVTVTEDFPPELIRPLPDIVFLEDQTINNVIDLDNYFNDIDGEVLYYTTGNEYVNLTINDDHTVDCSAPRDWFGTELVYFRANDPIGAHQEDLVLVTVMPINDAPILLTLPEQYGNESAKWVLDLEPYIVDVDNNISELVITTDSDYVVVSGSKLIFLGSKKLPEQITVTVSDGELNASQTLKLHVELVKEPRAPTLWDLFINLLPIIIMIIIISLVISGVVYRKKTRFTVEEVFLIHQGGTLITHLMRHQQANVDDIIFSGMFTAVQDFIKDSFAGDDVDGGETDTAEWALDELKLGDNNILIERSEHTYLAVIFSGEGSKRLRRIVVRLLDKIETEYATILPSWEGNISQLDGTKVILSVLIDTKEEPDMEVKPPEDDLAPFIPSSPPEPIQRSPLEPKPKTTVKTVESKMLPIAQPIRKRNGKPRSVELLSITGEQLGADQPGLTAWPMTSASKRRKRMKLKGNNEEKMPVALHISPKRQPPKTIAISKDQLPVNDKPLPIVRNSPHALDGPKIAKPVNINKPYSKKQFKFDPNKSPLQQLAELDE